MFRFLLGCCVTAIAYYVYANHPESVRRAIELGKKQAAVASHNVAALVGDRAPRSSDSTGGTTSTSNEIDYTRARKLAATMNGLSWDELWRVMDEDDFDRRAAAALVLLGRAEIPTTADGVDVVNRRYIRSSRPETVQTGFSYLGLLALQRDVSESAVVRVAKTYVDRHPHDVACDNAVWALGELGSEDLVPYFFEIIDNDATYGPAARERAFCCLVQCGRYTQARRLELVPRFIRVYETHRDPQTRAWTMQALAECAPGVRARSIEDWRHWWSRQ